MLADLAGLAQATSDWEFIWANRGLLIAGLWMTLQLTATALFLGFVLGLPAGVVEAYGGTFSYGAVRGLGVAIRGTPILVIIALAYFAFGLDPAFLAATVALGVRSAAYQSQIFRGAIESVGGGQMEAARAVGLSKVGAIRHVVLPQALRRSIPSFQNEFTIVLKDTSIAYAIGLSELLRVTTDLFVIRTSAVLEVILAVSLVYFVLTVVTNQALEVASDVFAIPGGGTR